MAIPVQNSIEAASTTANQWKKLFSGTANGGRSGTNVRNYSSNGPDLWLAVVPSGATAPTEPADESQVAYSVNPGSTYSLGSYGDYQSDVYIRAADGTAIPYRAWEVVGP